MRLARSPLPIRAAPARSAWIGPDQAQREDERAADDDDACHGKNRNHRHQAAPECRALRRLVQSNGKRQPSGGAFSRGVEFDRPDHVPIACNRREFDGRNDWPAVVGDNDVDPCPLLDAREKTIINDKSSYGDAAKTLVDRPDRLGSQEEEPPLIGQGGGVDLVRRLSDEGNEPRAELIR